MLDLAPRVAVRSRCGGTQPRRWRGGGGGGGCRRKMQPPGSKVRAADRSTTAMSRAAATGLARQRLRLRMAGDRGSGGECETDEGTASLTSPTVVHARGREGPVRGAEGQVGAGGGEGAARLGFPHTGTKQSFTPGGEPPLVPVPHPGVSIRD